MADSPNAELGEASEQVLGALDNDAGDLLRVHLGEPLVPTDVLEQQTRDYLEELEALVADGNVLDLEQAGEIAVRCERLLAEMGSSTPEEHRRLVQAAVRYFVSSNDDEDDLDSVIGFDDDGAVVEAVALAIGLDSVLDE